MLLACLFILLLLPWGFSFWKQSAGVDFKEWEADVSAFEAGLSMRPTASQYASANFSPKDREEDKILRL